jgi:NADH-ubiquinone oxidoreductase chain 1
LERKLSFYFFLFVLVFIGLRVYSTLISGWRRTSKFASIGGIRSCSQSISYEVGLAFFIIRGLMCFSSFRNYYFFTLLLIVFPCFFLRCVAETNRAPFDFREGERELISGFNIEFGSRGFVLLFLAEYGIILFFSFFMGLFFLKNHWALFFILFFSFIFIRSVYPRFRYDILMKLTWTKFVPFSLFTIWIYLLIL